MGNKFTELQFEGTFDLKKSLTASELKEIIGEVKQADIDRLTLIDKKMNIKTVYKRVVYCEDCEWWDADKKGEVGWCWNPKMMHDDRCLIMHNNDYCSKGEPKHD